MIADPEQQINCQVDYADLARKYHAIGFNVFPVDGTKKPPIVRAGEDARYPWGAWKIKRQTIADLNAMPWNKAAGVMGICGPGGYRCIDFDDVTDTSLITMCLDALGLSPYGYEWVVKTPGKIKTDGSRNHGYHIWVHCPELELDKGKIDLPATYGADHIELRAYNHYTLLPQSSHPDGGTYQFENGDPTDAPATVDADLLLTAYKLVTVQPAPKPLPQVQRASHESRGTNGAGHNPAFVNGAISNELNELARTTNERNNQLNTSAHKLAGYLWTNVISESELTEQLYRASVANGYVAKRGEAQTRATIKSGITSGKAKPRHVDNPKETDPGGANQMAADKAQSAQVSTVYTNGHSPAAPAPVAIPNLLHFDISDLGNAHAVEAMFPGQFAHTGAYGWMAWTGTHWDAESTAEARVIQAINEMLVERVKQAAGSGNMQGYQHLIKFCVANKGRVQGAEYQLQRLRSVTLDVAEFDSKPDMLNTLSGVVDLRTKQVHPHDPSQRFTYCLPINYVPGTDYSEWLDLLSKWLPADQLDGLRLMAGYSATGHTREEVLIYLLGPSRSGKGTLTETLREVLGHKITAELQFSTFTEQRSGDSQNFDLAPLKPCRVVFASESNEYERLNEAKVKSLTGGNAIYCSFKHKGHFNYKPQFKIWLSSNHPVIADPDDDAVWGRIRIFHFPNSFLGKEDKSLKAYWLQPDKLRQVLAWVIDGAYDWYRLGAAGIQDTPTGIALKASTRSELDDLAQWIKESCEVSTVYTEINSVLYNNYETWCKLNGITPKKQKAFSRTMQRKGYQSFRKASGIVWQGIKVAYIPPISTLQNP